MDTSETYIKMCDCEEVREHTPITRHDGAIWINAGETTVDIGSDRTVWLPRQDQIQEMASCVGYLALLNDFFFWKNQEESAEIIHGKEIPSGPEGYVTIEGGLESMEQLWLAYYMEEEHDKTWDGERWVSIK